ncbi:hypothetical protein EOE18_07500 [Novosphingobium umbonatum]|uniref:DUF2946 domain-containing protein n=1 Tax=Novosphingobium umbonatum TaxID=1908524 RepID=A0A437N7A8_9SPHN|nr:hypothetical protein [Novosphingobium umbonatum]RVU05815.1 hypothetical protein EOE18_07500 [Novosphingobium umbonatum]
MGTLRAFLLAHRPLAALLVALALCVKALVPTGYMLGTDTRTITVQICADSLGRQIIKQIEIGHKDSQKAKPDTSCAFSGLHHAAMGGADPILLALALLFILALGFAPWHAPLHKRLAYLRPPLRGPPARA